MKRLALIATVLISLVFPASAAAQPFHASGTLAPATSLSPAESALISQTTIINRACPAEGVAVPCALAEAHAIWIPAYLDKGARATALWHERGHLASHWLLTETERTTISAAFGWTYWHEERFADAYASCHVNERQRKDAAQWDIYAPRRAFAECPVISGATL